MFEHLCNVCDKTYVTLKNNILAIFMFLATDVVVASSIYFTCIYNRIA